MHLTCEEMLRSPEVVFAGDGGLDLGSGHGSPLDIDYACEGTLAGLDFLQDLYNPTEQVRSEPGSYPCTGSIVHAHWRFYRYDLLKAGLAPGLYARQQEWRWDGPDSYKKHRDQTKHYFLNWAHQSLTNFELYSAYCAAYNRAEPQLRSHYQKMFLVSEEKATSYADIALARFLGRAAGSAPGGGSKISSLEEAISQPTQQATLIPGESKQTFSFVASMRKVSLKK